MRSAHYNAPTSLFFWVLAHYNALRYDHLTPSKRSLMGLKAPVTLSPNLKISCPPEKACVIGYSDFRSVAKCA